MKAVTSYVALLRGINVGGNKKVPMATLKKMLEKLGYTNVKTLLNSGNAVFEAEKGTEASILADCEKAFEKTFGFTSSIIVRTTEGIRALVKADPFKGITVTPATRLYVTFLKSKPKHSIKIPYVSPDKSFRILKVTDCEVLSVINVELMGSVDAMAILEKEFGKDITTRNWNTVLKLLG